MQRRPPASARLSRGPGLEVGIASFMSAGRPLSPDILCFSIIVAVT